MADVEHKALIRQGSRSLSEVGAGPRSVLSSIVADALSIAHESETALTSTRFRIGKYEFREPDYRQILIWAKALKLETDLLVKRLENSFFLHTAGSICTTFGVEEGAIVSLAWDLTALPLEKFHWVDGLSIRGIAVFGSPKERPNISFSAPSRLQWLVIGPNCLSKLDLGNTPTLTRLCCCDNQLTELDLSNVPELTGLWCDRNELTELDLSNVPALNTLSCSSNPLTELDLSNVPKLFALSCSDNQLTELDLSNVSKLTRLWCHGNQLTELDLSNVPELIEFWCADNQLTELDLSNVPELTRLWCAGNQLTELDLSNVSKLTRLWCHGNQLTEFDLSNVPELTEIDS